jgi:MoaA/NifB/PqqE/SkfB family radical SAM enzyme
MRRTLPFPRRVNVELTNHCNQRCVLCPRQGFTRPLGFMEPALFEALAVEAAGHPTALWLHFLGESLLHPGALELAARAKALGVRQVGLSTNGVSLAHAADALLDSGIDRLEISLDALDREAYRAIRGRDHFDRVLHGIEHYFARKRERALERPVTSLQFMRRPEVEAHLSLVRRRLDALLGPRDFVMTIEPASFGGAIDAPEGAARARSAQRGPCSWLFESLVVLQDGTVVTCGVDWDARHPVGTLRESSLLEIWNGDEMRRRRELHLAGRFAEVAPCDGCTDWVLADGSGYRNVRNG